MELSHLTEEELDHIHKVAKRDEEQHQQDQIRFDQIKRDIYHWQEEDLKPNRTLTKLCVVCRKTDFKDTVPTLCSSCGNNVCSLCFIEDIKNGVTCVLCKNQRNLEEMSGAWVLKFQNPDDDVKLSNKNISKKESQMPPKGQNFDGVHGLSPSEQIVFLLSHNLRQEDAHVKLMANDDQINNKAILMPCENGKKSVKVSREYKQKRYDVVATIHSCDDFNNEEFKITTTKEIEEPHKRQESSPAAVSRIDLHQKKKKNANGQCPIHGNNTRVSIKTILRDYDILYPPTNKGESAGPEKIQQDGVSSYSKHLNENFYENDGTKTMTHFSITDTGRFKFKQQIYIRQCNENNVTDYDGCFLDNSYSSSFDLSIPGSYIDSYYGD